MSLIIAIEPDRDQAAQLKDLVRRHTGAELILADTTARAIGAIEQRVPDLVLVPAFLSPEDDEALTAALRLTEAAAHVQTLTIPMLGEPQAKSTTQGVLSRLRWDQPRASSPDSCDPKLFAQQITEYLDRVRHERGHLTGSNGKGGQGSNGTGRKTDAAKSSAAAEKARPVATSKPAKPVAVPKVVSAPATDPAVDTRALEAALANVADAGLAAGGVADDIARKPAGTAQSDDLEGLEQGLSALVERLNAEDAQPSAEVPPPAIESAAWATLKELESREYAMPKDLLPHDDIAPPAANDVATPVSEPAAQPTAAQPTAAQPVAAPPVAAQPVAAPPAGAQPAEPSVKNVSSEWGDLMESLKKDLGR